MIDPLRALVAKIEAWEGDSEAGIEEAVDLFDEIKTALLSAPVGSPPQEQEKDFESRGGKQAVSERQDLPQTASGDSSTLPRGRNDERTTS